LGDLGKAVVAVDSEPDNFSLFVGNLRQQTDYAPIVGLVPHVGSIDEIHPHVQWDGFDSMGVRLPLGTGVRQRSEEIAA
jgi:hypothetical protein